MNLKEKKEAIIDIINRTSGEYWEACPDENVKSVEETGNEKQLRKFNEKAAKEIILLFK